MKNNKLTPKIKRYYPRDLLNYYASLEVGKEAVIVEKTKQPPEGYIIVNDASKDRITFAHKDKSFDHYEFEHKEPINIKLPFPIGATVGIPETRLWKDPFPGIYGVKWRSPVTMPNSAIRLLFKVTGTRVCQAREVTIAEICRSAISIDRPIRKAFQDWYSIRYGAWEPEAWVEVAMVERIEKP